MKLSNPITFTPGDEWQKQPTFAEVCAFTKGRYDIAEDYPDFDWNGLNEERWVQPKVPGEEGIHFDSFESRAFDLMFDFDAYYSDFRRFYSIDLLTDEVDWIAFRFMLSALFSYDGAIAARARARSYKPQKGEASRSIAANKRLKELYKLEDDKKNPALDDLWGTITGAGK